MGKFKDHIYDVLVRKNPNVQYEYERYVMENIKEHYEHHMKHLRMLFRLKWHYQIKKRTTPLLYWDKFAEISQNLKQPETGKQAVLKDTKKAEKIYYYENDEKRLSVEEFLGKLLPYQVISFDIFDTLIYRSVEKPNDVFHLMSSEMGQNDFTYIRKQAEKEARDSKERREGHREIVLSEIYDILENDYHIERKWMQREIGLELELSMPNPYMQKVYQLLCTLQSRLHKTIVFTTDMYLPLEVIQQLLKKNGYDVYDKIFLSNECKARKGDGTLQKILAEEYQEQTIVHVGDNLQADIEKTKEAGIATVYNADSHFVYREPELENIAGSFYRAVIQTTMNTGLWDKDPYYSHGYRVGGILAAGYCEFLNKLVKKKQIDKILFCSRDCDILYQVYEKFYKKTDAEYIKISRYAIFNITTEHYLYDLDRRYIMRYLNLYKSRKTIGTILLESGYGYLIDELEEYNLDRYQFPCAITDERKFHNFIKGCAEKIKEHNRESIQAAKQYFSEMIGDAKKLLIVDIGWSGTCITALKYFIREQLKDKQCQVSGALMCTNRDDTLKNSIQFGEIEAYINTPFENMDITRYIYPGPPKSRSVTLMDKLHMPLEFLFTSTEPTLLSYQLGEDQEVCFEYSSHIVPNPEQITQMQAGILDFVSTFLTYTKRWQGSFLIPPYTAFLPLKEAISHERYSYEIYKDFLYDAMSAPYSTERESRYAELFERSYAESVNKSEDDKYKKRIVFISPEMVYSGAPRSLLRMCRVAVNLGYAVSVWSAQSGPFMEEYEKAGIAVKVVTEQEIRSETYSRVIECFDMAVCNTIMTAEYARVCSQYIPTVWYIREATNIPDFIVNNLRREYILKNSLDIYCVSDYAKAAIEQFTDHPVKVIHNCVEDEADMAVPYTNGSDPVVKFVQFGTMEYRKGYDVLLEAYLRMPKEYQSKAELYFAGGFINSGTPFCSYLFRKMQGLSNVHYLGLVKGEENKIATLSKMDVVVVASRDESCSLVALEGAMLSKPLIVTENVGAKYMVSEENGMVVKTADVNDLMTAMMQMIDRKSELAKLGAASRKMYDTYASMQSYTQDMKEMYALTAVKKKAEFKKMRERNREVFSEEAIQSGIARLADTDLTEKEKTYDRVIVSLTSHPGRIGIVYQTIQSLLEQSVTPYKILLWLSEDQFEGREADLPGILLALEQDVDYFEIRFVKGDIGPHKKYYYTMKEYPDDPVIIVDDDAVYDRNLVERLLESYQKYPDCVSAMRVNLINFKRDGSFMDYAGWIMDYKILLDIPSTQLVPVGVGGVLYPPHTLPEEAFDIEAITENCLYCDDLWLKIMASHDQYKTVAVKRFCTEKLIDGSQDVALWHKNVFGDNNDRSLKHIMSYYDRQFQDLNALMEWLHKDRFI